MYQLGLGTIPTLSLILRSFDHMVSCNGLCLLQREFDDRYEQFYESVKPLLLISVGFFF